MHTFRGGGCFLRNWISLFPSITIFFYHYVTFIHVSLQYMWINMTQHCKIDLSMYHPITIQETVKTVIRPSRLNHHSIISSFHYAIVQSFNHFIIPSLYHSIISSFHHSIIPSYHHYTITPLHHSIIQPFHNSILPSFHHSIILSFHHSIIPSFQNSIIP